MMFAFTSLLISCVLLSKEAQGLHCMVLNHHYKDYLNSNCMNNYPGQNYCRGEQLPCSPNCSNTDLFWQVVDSNRGHLDVFYKLPQTDCNMLKVYTVALIINENLSKSECNNGLQSDFNNLQGQIGLMDLHSCRSFSSNLCSMCNSVVAIPFQHVYTGCYLFRIEARGRSKTEKIIIPPQFISTNYSKINTTLKKPEFVFNYNGENELEILVTYPFIPSMSILRIMDVEHSFQESCINSRKSHSACVTCLDNTEMLCYSTYNGSKPKCLYKGKNMYLCIFRNITQTDFCVLLYFEDERCQVNTAWSDKKDACSWTVMNYAVQTINSIPTEALPSEIQPETSIRLLGCKRRNEVWEHQKGWVRHLVDNKEVRLVYVTTPISHMFEEAFKNPKLKISYKDSTSFDSLFPYTLASLVDISSESYKRIFVVRLLSNVEGNNTLTFLNPITSYALPTHLDKFVHDIKNKPFKKFQDVPTLEHLTKVQTFISCIENLVRNVNNTNYINDIIHTN